MNFRVEFLNVMVAALSDFQNATLNFPYTANFRNNSRGHLLHYLSEIIASGFRFLVVITKNAHIK